MRLNAARHLEIAVCCCVFKELNVTSDSQAKHFVWKGLGTEVMPLGDQNWRKLTNSQSGSRSNQLPSVPWDPTKHFTTHLLKLLADATIQMDPEDIMLR